MCDALGFSRATYYRMTRIELHPVEKKKQFSPRKLTLEEEEKVLKLLNSDRFCDMSPGEIHATLLDESVYLCSQRTMYRILERNKQNVQRRQKQPGSYARPELLATRQINYGHGTLRSLRAQRNGHIIISTRLWMSTAESLLVGWSPTENLPRWPAG